jgi:chromosome partitioning protein
MGKVIFIGSRKGGVGKTTTTASLGFGLAKRGKRVLLIDADSQHSLTVSLGLREPERLPFTLASVMTRLINETEFDPTADLSHYSDGVDTRVEALDLLPANNSLAGIELALAPLIGRETVLRQYIDKVKSLYDFIIIDTSPTLDLLTINALAAADGVIIPVCPKFLDVKGLELLLRSVAQIKRQINPALAIDGILFTMTDRRSAHARQMIDGVSDAYGGNIKIFGQSVPNSVRAAECAALGVSIFNHDPRGKVAAAYDAFTEEVLCCG